MSSLSTRTITLGSRPSKLARWQTDHVLEQLKAARPDLSYQVVTLVTEGDKRLDKPLPEIGGKGVFTFELETALRSGQIDLAVHSLKDLPVDNAAALCVGAISPRADAHDVLISPSGLTLAQLPTGARVGTSSLRRQVQLQAARPDLTFLPLRGNVDTRIHKAMQGDYDAIILAAAGIERLGLVQYVSEYLSFEVMLPAPGQGALAIQCRAEDAELLELLKQVHDPATARAVTAERAFLSGLGGGCSAPVAAYATAQDERLDIRGLVASPDGRRIIHVAASGTNPKALGKQMASQALEQGAGELL
jgi:hydroxymethylbilane synthase